MADAKQQKQAALQNATKTRSLLEMQTVSGKTSRGHVRYATHERAVAVQVGCSHVDGVKQRHGCALANIAENSNGLCLDVLVVHVAPHAVQFLCAVRALDDATETTHLWQV